MYDIELIIADFRYQPHAKEIFNLLLKAKHGKGVLSILIGPNEGKTIVLEMNHIQMKRPLAHDLFLQLCAKMDCHLEKVLLYSYHDGIYGVRIYANAPVGELILESRVSDAVVLALKTNIPIFITPEVFELAKNDRMNPSIKNSGEKVLSDMDWFNMKGMNEVEQDIDEVEDTIVSTEIDLTLVEMDALQKMLEDALNKEQYEWAAEIDDEIKRRKNEE